MSLSYKLLITFYILLASCTSFSQLSGTVYVGISQPYISLTGNGGLFQTINNQGLSGNVTAIITSNLSENGNHALNQWSGSFTLNIVPSSASIKNISGSDNNTLIELNGADRVTFDGRFNGTGKYLRIVNTSSSGSTIALMNDATYNVFTYCIIEGDINSTTEGIIHFRSTTGSAGNDFNTLSFCNISPAGSNPINAIYSDGSTSTTAAYNSNNSILNNNIFDFYRNGENCSGVLLTAGSTDWTISGNSFYQTTARTNANSTGFNVILINTADANNLTISGNFIGGSSPNCGGTAWVFAGNVSNYFHGIRFMNAGTASASNVDGNTVANIDFSSNPANSNNVFFTGIMIQNGRVNVGSLSGNSIGNSVSNGSIELSFTGNTTNLVNRGIDFRGLGNINNNTVGSINVGGNNNGIVRFEGIYIEGSPSQSIDISNNLIGSTTIPGSIQTTSGITMQMTGIYSGLLSNIITINANTVSHFINISTNTNSLTRGIFQNVGTAAGVTITNNTVEELYGAGSSTNRFPNVCAIIGIFTGSSSNAQLISGNIIRGLRGTGNYDSYVQGFAPYNRDGEGIFSRNKIYDLTHSSTSGSPKIYGINLFWGSWEVYNNMVSLTNGELSDKHLTIDPAAEQENINNFTKSYAENTSGYLCSEKNEPGVQFIEKVDISLPDAFSNGAEIKGIHEEGEFGSEYYYNSVYVGGTAVLGSANSWAFDRPLTSWPTPVTLRNNLFVSARTGGTGNHFAIGNEINPPALNWSSTSSNYNVFISTNPNTVGNWGTSIQSISQWRTSSSGDILSWCTTTGSITPSNLFTDVSNGNLNIITSNVEAWICSGKGIAITGQNGDYNGDSRASSISSGVTDIGADEFGTVAVNPPLATESAAPAPGTTTSYTLWNRTLCSIDWDAANTTVPTGMNVRYWSGTLVPAPSGSYGAGYLSVTKSGGQDNDTTYDFTLYFGDNETFTISTPSSNSRLARYGINEPNPSWQAFVPAGTNKHESELKWNISGTYSVKVRGIRYFSDFALTDASAPLPVELCSFTASVNNRTANLTWVTCSETNNMGFDIERRQYHPEANNYNAWSKIGFVNGNGTTSEEISYEYKDNKLVTGTYQYRLKQRDFNGNFEYFNLSSPAEVIIGKPGNAELYQNYPNPSNPNTKVDFQIPFDSKVSLKIYDITGREIVVLINKQLDAGYYTSDFNGSNFASGVYFYRLIAESDGQKFSKTMKMILIK